MKLFYLSLESPIEDLRWFRTQEGLKKGKGPIKISGLLSLIQRFEETGSLCDRPRIGTPCLSESPTSAVASQMDTLNKQVTNEVSSVRKVQKTTGIPKTSVFRILHDVLNLCPYKLQSLNQFLPNVTAKGKEFVWWALMKASSDAQWLVNVLWTGEAPF